jgi:hypothetical protein
MAIRDIAARPAKPDTPTLNVGVIPSIAVEKVSGDSGGPLVSDVAVAPISTDIGGGPLLVNANPAGKGDDKPDCGKRAGVDDDCLPILTTEQPVDQGKPGKKDCGNGKIAGVDDDCLPIFTSKPGPDDTSDSSGGKAAGNGKLRANPCPGDVKNELNGYCLPPGTLLALPPVVKCDKFKAGTDQWCMPILTIEDGEDDQAAGRGKAGGNGTLKNVPCPGDLELELNGYCVPKGNTGLEAVTKLKACDESGRGDKEPCLRPTEFAVGVAVAVIAPGGDGGKVDPTTTPGGDGGKVDPTTTLGPNPSLDKDITPGGAGGRDEDTDDSAQSEDSSEVTADTAESEASDRTEGAGASGNDSAREGNQEGQQNNTDALEGNSGNNPTSSAPALTSVTVATIGLACFALF